MFEIRKAYYHAICVYSSFSFALTIDLAFEAIYYLKKQASYCGSVLSVLESISCGLLCIWLSA